MAHTEQQAKAEAILSRLKVPYVTQDLASFPRGVYGCRYHFKMSIDTREEVDLHWKKYGAPGIGNCHIYEKSYEVDILAYGSEAIEITGTGTSSFDAERVKWFATKHPEVRFHYFPNQVIEKYPEVFEQYMKLLGELKGKNAGS